MSHVMVEWRVKHQQVGVAMLVHMVSENIFREGCKFCRAWRRRLFKTKSGFQKVCVRDVFHFETYISLVFPASLSRPFFVPVLPRNSALCKTQVCCSPVKGPQSHKRHFSDLKIAGVSSAWFTFLTMSKTVKVPILQRRY